MTSSGGHGFVRDSDGNITTFDVPGSIGTYSRSINPTGAITGLYYDASDVVHGFVRDSNGNITTFDVPRSVETGGFSISQGVITGYCLGK